MKSEKEVRRVLYNTHKARSLHMEAFPNEPPAVFDGTIMALEYVLGLVGGQYNWETDLIEQEEEQS